MIRLKTKICQILYDVYITCFNPTMIRLKTCLCKYHPETAYRFQSHHDSIKNLHGNRRPWKRSFCFNPTMIRLKTMVTRKAGCSWSGFNPTMIRLKTLYGTLYCKLFYRFQSHHDSIKNLNMEKYTVYVQTMFQSHHDSIKNEFPGRRKVGCTNVSIPP